MLMCQLQNEENIRFDFIVMVVYHSFVFNTNQDFWFISLLSDIPRPTVAATLPPTTTTQMTTVTAPHPSDYRKGLHQFSPINIPFSVTHFILNSLANERMPNYKSNIDWSSIGSKNMNIKATSTPGSWIDERGNLVCSRIGSKKKKTKINISVPQVESTTFEIMIFQRQAQNHNVTLISYRITTFIVQHRQFIHIRKVL